MVETWGAGELRHSVQIQAFSEGSPDGRGQSAKTWSTKFSTRAAIKPLNGRTAEFAHQLYDTATHEIITRYYSGVTADDRIVYGSRTFNIGYAQNVDEESRWLRLLVTEAM